MRVPGSQLQLVGVPATRRGKGRSMMPSTPRTTFLPAGRAEIAQFTGYESEFSLSKSFKRAFGVAPGAYRNGPG